jgi:secreted effector protein SseD
MNTLNLTPSHPADMRVQVDMPLPNYVPTGEEAISIINALMIKFIALAKEQARLLQDYHASQQETLFKKQMLALATKQNAIDETFNAGISQASAQIIGGGVSFIGGVASLSSSVGQAGTTIANGVSGLSQGSTKVYADTETRAAQMKQLLGDTQTAAAEQTDKGLEKILRQIDEIRKDLDQVQRDAVHISKQLNDAIKLPG